MKVCEISYRIEDDIVEYTVKTGRRPNIIVLGPESMKELLAEQQSLYLIQKCNETPPLYRGLEVHMSIWVPDNFVKVLRKEDLD